MDTRSKVVTLLEQSFSQLDGDSGKYGVSLEFFLYKIETLSDPCVKPQGSVELVLKACVDLGWASVEEEGIHHQKILSGAIDTSQTGFKVFAGIGQCIIKVESPLFPTLQELKSGLLAFLPRLISIVESTEQYVLSSPIWPNLTPVEDELHKWWFPLSRYNVLSRALPDRPSVLLPLSLASDETLSYFLNRGIHNLTAIASIQPIIRLSGIDELNQTLSLFNYITPVIHALFAQPSLHHGNELRLFGIRELLRKGVSSQSGMYDNLFVTFDSVVDFVMKLGCFYMVKKNDGTPISLSGVSLSYLKTQFIKDPCYLSLITQFPSVDFTSFPGSIGIPSFCQIAGGGGIESYVQKVMVRVAFVAGIAKDLRTSILLMATTGWGLQMMREADMQTYSCGLGMLRYNEMFMHFAQNLVAHALISLENNNFGDGNCFGLYDIYMKLFTGSYFPRDCSLIDHVLQKGCDETLIDRLRLKGGGDW